MKTCANCKVEDSEDQFRASNGHKLHRNCSRCRARHSHCAQKRKTDSIRTKDCQRAKEYYYKNRRSILARLKYQNEEERAWKELFGHAFAFVPNQVKTQVFSL